MARALLARSLIPKSNPSMGTASLKVLQNNFNKKIFIREMSTSKKLSNSPEFLSFLGDVDAEQKQMIKKILNFKMIGGKSTKVRNIVYDTFRRIARNDRDVVKLVTDAVENTKPICEVVKVGVAGTVYDVPGIVGRDRQQALAVRWIFGAALKRRESSRKTSLEKCLFAEILDAYRKKGVAHKRKETVHGLASMNRSFAHFRWW